MNVAVAVHVSHSFDGRTEMVDGIEITGETAGDGMVSTDRVAVGVNGTVPPM